MKAISLFSGAGGMDLGFKQVGVQIVWANDNYVYACKTYEKNFGISPLLSDIRKVKKFPKADLVIACNPCQGFSIIGKRDENDKRNLLYREIFRVIRQVRPKYVVVENVPGLRLLYNGKFLKRIIAGFRRLGFRTKWSILDARDYGVPQRRQRLIIVGVRSDLHKPFEFPLKTHGPGRKPYVTLKEAIGDLPNPRKGEYFKSNRWPFFYMSRNRVTSWDNVCFTIQTNADFIPLHPSSPPMKKIEKDKFAFVSDPSMYRRLSVRECARIQTFPDDFEFVGYLGSKYRLVGNAVPPILARKIAQSIKQLDLN